jgi:hypothetical protein
MPRKLLLFVLAAALLAVAFVPASADPICIKSPVPGLRDICIDTPQGPGPDPCLKENPTGDGASSEPTHPGENPLCSDQCVAIGLYLEVSPIPIVLPNGEVTQLSRSAANANAFGFGGFGFGQGHGDAHQARADVPSTLGSGVVESKCDVFAVGQGDFVYRDSVGQADTAQFSLNLAPVYSIPLEISFDVLCEDGHTTNGLAALPAAPPPPPPVFSGPYAACQPPPVGFPPSITGANRADIANLVINGLPIATLSAPPNTVIPIPPPYPGLLADLYLNEQFPGSFDPFGGCYRWSGDAFRLVVKNPLGGTLATVILSWVSTCT